MVKNPAMQEMWEIQVQSLGQEDPLEEEIATHSNILAWRIPWMEEPGRLQSMGSQRVVHDRVASTNTRLKCALGNCLRDVSNMLRPGFASKS